MQIRGLKINCWSSRTNLRIKRNLQWIAPSLLSSICRLDSCSAHLTKPTQAEGYGEMGEANVGKRMFPEAIRELIRAVEIRRKCRLFGLSGFRTRTRRRLYVKVDRGTLARFPFSIRKIEKSRHLNSRRKRMGKILTSSSA